jgi:beta-xylosidase
MKAKYRRRLQLASRLSIVAVMLVAGWLLSRAFADTFNVKTEAESGVLAGQAAACTGQGASQGKIVRFGTGCNQADRTFTNPVKHTTADPGVLAWQGKYYMVGTSGIPTFHIYVSDDLVTWEPANAAVFDGTHPWGKDRFWAPEIHKTTNGFAAYYSASDSAGVLRIGVATAPDILGPYTDLGRPLFVENYWAIDANFFRDDNGKQYVYWKEDGGDTRIFGQEVDAAGTTLTGPRVELLKKGLAWEGDKGIEGTWVTKKDGQYYMFYSGNYFNSPAYAVGVAKSAGPLTPFAKKGDPILTSSTRWKGPGHNTVARVGTTDYMIYHAWDGSIAGERATLVDKITWAGGWPNVGGGVPTDGLQPYPQ